MNNILIIYTFLSESWEKDQKSLKCLNLQAFKMTLIPKGRGNFLTKAPSPTKIRYFTRGHREGGPTARSKNFKTPFLRD